MTKNMSSMNFYRKTVTPVLMFLGCLLLFSGCAAQNGSPSGDYTNPGRPEGYNAEERGYEKPWPFGDVGNGH